ncbi:putative histone-lysine N-methyltransferase, H3 lysine-4 specific [Cryptosporidium felis]|nr:putative histone-lysine N-methyltransferase, H3 lysine-4 specific [Cryptosporidium felis]
MEEVNINQIIAERGVKYARYQILDSRAKCLKDEINVRCRDLLSVDELISYSCGFSPNISLNEGFNNNKSQLPHVYCSTLGLNNGIVDPNSQKDLYESIITCINQGVVSKNIGITKITDYSHPVRLATPINRTCYTLVWRKDDLSEAHTTPIVLGEYTGDVKYVGDDDVNDESYSFQLTFKSSAFKFSGTVLSSNFQSEEFSVGWNNQINTRFTYFPDSFEYSDIENSSSPKKSLFFSNNFEQGANDPKYTDCGIRKLGARLLLPNDNEYIVSADKSCNEMAFLNHYECVFNNNFNFRINVQWHSVYLDGWPHIILTSIPGIGIKSGDELTADFGENWFHRIKRISENNVINELISLRSLYNSLIHEENEEAKNNSIMQLRDIKLMETPIELGIKGLINKYETCEICQNQAISYTHKNYMELKPKITNSSNESKFRFLICNGCSRTYHLHCVNRPELLDLKISAIQWFCFQCISLTLRILPSLLYVIPNITEELINSVVNIYSSYEKLIPGVLDARGDVTLRSTDELYRENSKSIVFRPSEFINENQRYYNEHAGLEGLSKLKPCYLCYSSSMNSNQSLVGVATVCRIHRLHIAPDYDEFFNSVQYVYNTENGNSEGNSLQFSLVTEDSYYKRKQVKTLQQDTDNVLKSHLKKLSGSKYIIERSRRIICSLRNSLYQSEKHRVELLYKIEKLRKVQDEYFKSISECNGNIPILSIKLGKTRINKEFSGKLYQGVATKYYPKERIFHVEYFDGDREDLEYKDFISLLSNDIQAQRINIEELSNIENSTEISDENSLEMNKPTKEYIFDIPKLYKDEIMTSTIFNSNLIDSQVKLVPLNNCYNDSIIGFVNIIHKFLIKESNAEKCKNNSVRIREVPYYEYVDRPYWNLLYGSLRVDTKIIKYHIGVLLLQYSYSTITLEINSKIELGDYALVKNIPITMGSDFNFTLNVCDNELDQCKMFKTIRLSVIEILSWTQNRIFELAILESDSRLLTRNVQNCQYDENDTIRERSTNEMTEILNIDNNSNIVEDNWLQKANMIAQILQPYPNGIKWINETHSWKVVYHNETGQKLSKLFVSTPFDENKTVESMYLKACKFVSVSQTNNKVIKMLGTNRRLKNDLIEVSSPLEKFIFNDWESTIEDFLARYNLCNPERCVYSLNELNTEINSLRPFPDNLDWCGTTFSFIVTLPDGEKRKLRLENFEFNIIHCYSSAYYLAVENKNNVDEEFHSRKIRKYNSRIKNFKPISIKKGIGKKHSTGKFETLETKELIDQSKNLTLNKEPNKDGKRILGRKKREFSSLQNQVTEQDNSSNTKENISNEVLNSDEFQDLPKKLSLGRRKSIVRASPAPSDPLSRARIIEYSRKADELRPFPHGITWCYRSARFKVRYRRSSDGCWTATSFTPTKFNSVQEAFESALEKLAAHISDYKNSTEIPVIPKKKHFQK